MINLKRGPKEVNMRLLKKSNNGEALTEVMLFRYVVGVDAAGCGENSRTNYSCTVNENCGTCSVTNNGCE